MHVLLSRIPKPRKVTLEEAQEKSAGGVTLVVPGPLPQPSERHSQAAKGWLSTFRTSAPLVLSLMALLR